MAVDNEEEMGMVMLTLVLSKKDRKPIKEWVKKQVSQEQHGKAGTVTLCNLSLNNPRAEGDSAPVGQPSNIIKRSKVSTPELFQGP